MTQVSDSRSTCCQSDHKTTRLGDMAILTYDLIEIRSRARAPSVAVKYGYNLYPS